MTKYKHLEALPLSVDKLLNIPLIKSTVVIFSGILITAIFFRALLFSHGTQDFGNPFDGLIAFSIIQHWYNVFRGIEPWSALGYFYPYPNSLGYNDGYFLYGVIYSILRLLQLKMLTALGMTNIIIRLTGFYSFFYLCYRQLSLKFSVCLLTAAIFSLSNAVYNESGHVQIFSVSFAPLLTIMLINYCRQLLIDQNTGKAILWGSIAGIFYAAWLLSAYYMAWFYALFAFFCLLFMIIYQYRHKLLLIKKPKLSAIFVPLIVTFVALIPFLMVYLSVGQQTGMHSYRAAFVYTPNIFNLLNVSDQNFLWGKLLSYFSLPGDEFIVGYPFVFLVILVAAIVSSIRDKRRDVLIFYRPMTYAILVSIFISITIFNKFSLWGVIWGLFPGAKGLRVVIRYWIYLVFPMSILISYYLSLRMSWSSTLVTVLISSLLILEQISIIKTTNLQPEAQQAFIDAVKPIPEQCQVFFVTGTRYEEQIFNTTSLNNVDAMLIAEMFGLKTINGTSTFSPSDWNFDYFPKETYLSRVNDFAKKHNIKNLCSFDIGAMKWYVY